MSKFSLKLSLVIVALFSMTFNVVSAETVQLNPTEISVKGNISPSSFVTLQGTQGEGFDYAFSDISQKSNPRQSIKSLSTTKTSTIYMTLVQWGYKTYEHPESEQDYSVDMAYRLVNILTNKSVETIRVSGKYTNENKTIEFSNVPAGNYRIDIINEGQYYAAGNGYLRAYYK